MMVQYRCIKDLGGLGLLTVGKVYDVKVEAHINTVINDAGREIFLSDMTIHKYFERV